MNAILDHDVDNPEWTEEMLLKSTSLEASELPESFKRTAHGGRPRQSVTKKSTTIRLPSNVIDFFKAGLKDGKGWQTRLSAALEEYVEQHKHSQNRDHSGN